MTLAAGTKLAHYEISSQLGKGGMGEVYRAKDQKLGRDVAIKVLPEEFAKDTDRVARFQREAKLLASLNHPNIAAIHGLEESDGTHFLVLELIEGDTLADRLKRGAIPVEESLKLALQIAEALEAAHEKGVIHRDLKPANIKVTPDGKVKILDFGLAKAFAGDQAEVNLSHSPTLSEAATLQGVILTMRFLVALHDGQIFWLINILAHFIPLFLGGVWIARKIQSRFLLHGVLVGIIANLLIFVILPILMLLDVRGPADVTSSQATRGLLLAVKMIGSATGAYVGGRLKHKNLQQIPME